MTRPYPLSFSEQLGHAARVRSLKGAGLAVADSLAYWIAPRWWQEKAPWYVGRALRSLRLEDVWIDGARFQVPDDESQTSFKGLLSLERYEVLERYAIVQWLPRDLPVIELGASIGVVACLVNRRLSDRSRHVCVEANPAIISVLRANADRNGCQFRIVNAALAYGGDTVTFGVSTSVVESSLTNDSPAGRVTVPTVQLGRLIDDAGFESCSVVCDIEGAEAALMAREADVLEKRVHMVLMEVHPQALSPAGIAELSERFQRAGFERVWSRGDVWVMKKAPTISGSAS